MSHKDAKLQRKEARNNPQIIITLTQERGVECSFPTNMALTMNMLGDALRIIGQHAKFIPPSPIVQVPPGAKIQ